MKARRLPRKSATRLRSIERKMHALPPQARAWGRLFKRWKRLKVRQYTRVRGNPYAVERYEYGRFQEEVGRQHFGTRRTARKYIEHAKSREPMLRARYRVAAFRHGPYGHSVRIGRTYSRRTTRLRKANPILPAFTQGLGMALGMQAVNGMMARKNPRRRGKRNPYEVERYRDGKFHDVPGRWSYATRQEAQMVKERYTAHRAGLWETFRVAAVGHKKPGRGKFSGKRYLSRRTRRLRDRGGFVDRFDHGPRRNCPNMPASGLTYLIPSANPRTFTVLLALGKSVTVSSLNEASRAVRNYIESRGIGGTQWADEGVFRSGKLSRSGEIRDDAGREVGRVSYNGRVWTTHGDEIIEARDVPGVRYPLAIPKRPNPVDRHGTGLLPSKVTPGQKIVSQRPLTLAQARSFPGLQANLAGFKKFHENAPVRVDEVLIDDGQPGLTKRAVFLVGESPSVEYQIPGGIASNKAGKGKEKILWRHKMGELGGKKPLLVHDAQSGISSFVGGTFKVDDWYRH